MKHLKKHFKAFTLVELIIVITILAILATIAFVSFQSYTRDARDASRLTTISSVQEGLDVFFVKASNYPVPDNATVYTGGNTQIQMGVLGDTVSKILSIHSIPMDPLTKGNYVYSIGGNGYYYQIGTEKENPTSLITNTTYADNKIALIKGNYKLDPTLPSLIPVKSSITSSGIFDPSVCFIVDGGSNNFSSTASDCIKKKDMNLKAFDTSLIGYWDMETLSGSMLKDFSGNNNSFLCSDRNGAATTDVDCTTKLSNTGAIGKSLFFSQNGSTLSSVARTNGNIMKNGTGLIDYSNGFSISYVMLEDVTTYTQSPLYHYNFWYHRNPSSLLSSIRSYTFSGEILNGNEISCRPVHATCINNMSFLKDYNYNPLKYNLHTISFGHEFEYYINGVLIYKLPVEKTSNMKQATPFMVGGTTSVSAGFNGYIDDVKIFDRPLSKNEVVQQAKIAGF